MRDDFLWGTSISGGQCEGGISSRGETVVDPIPQGRDTRIPLLGNPAAILAHPEGRLPNHLGTDFFGHWKEDVRLLAEAGCKALRFSPLWSRIVPEAGAEPNAEGIAFYSGVIDEIIACGMTPVLTTIHFDMPLWMVTAYNGFASAEGLAEYKRYVDVLVSAYADRVKHWVAYCEVNGIDEILYLVGGALVREREAEESVRRRAELNLMLGSAYLATKVHEADARALAGCEFAFYPCYTADSSPEAYARKLEFDQRIYRMSDVMVRGRFPFFYHQLMEQAGIAPTAEEAALLARGTLDFIAPSYYRSACVDANGIVPNSALPVTPFGWTVDPLGFRTALNEVYARYELPIMIVENGLGTYDRVDADGSINDNYRIDFLRRHIEQMKLAVEEDGVDMLGYLTWCGVDCVSTSEGFVSKRYGLIYVDLDDEGNGTLARTPKKSAAWYRRVSETNGADLG